MAILEPVAYKVARSLMECFCAALAANAAADDTLAMPGRCCLRAGVDIPLDVTADGFILQDQCCIGEAFVKINGVFPASSTDFTTPDAEPVNGRCQMQRLTIALEMGTIRCIDDDKGCDENELKLRWMLNDMMASYTAVCCWAKDMKRPEVVGPSVKWFAGGWEQGGPDGDCLTGLIQVFANIPGPGCC